MDCIDRAVQKGYLSSSIVSSDMTWESLREKANGLPIVLWGIGQGFTFLMEQRINDSLHIECLIDNADDKKGKKLKEYDSRFLAFEEGNIVIRGEEFLYETYNHDAIILLTGMKNYLPIYVKLCGLGYRNVFVMLEIEYNSRNSNDNPCTNSDLSFKEWIDYFVDKCFKLPIQRDKIIFCAFNTISDHCKYIYEEMIRRFPNMDYVWVLNDVESMNEHKNYIGRAVCENDIWSYLYEMMTSQIWIYFADINKYVKKKEGQIYIQVKHWPSVTLKKCYLDTKTLLDSPMRSWWIENGKLIDVILSGSQFDSDFCRRAFGFDKNPIIVGSPRSDIVLCNEEKKHYLKKMIGIDDRYHVVMYAPTFRFKNNSKSEYSFKNTLDYKELLNVLSEKFGGKWLVIVRFHPLVKDLAKQLANGVDIFDYSEYEDGQELVAISDVLVSDYSSIMFEPAFAKKPVFLYTPDLDDYQDKEYEFAINVDELPFPKAADNMELYNNINSFCQNEYELYLDEFFSKYGVQEDGKASIRAVDEIEKVMKQRGLMQY